MKTIIIFDVDNTIYSKTYKKVLPKTKKLIKTLYNNPDIELGVATGRGLKKLDVIDDILYMFKYKIVVNGAAVFVDEKMIFDEPIKIEDIKEVLALTKGKDFNIGMVGINDEAVNFWDDRIGYGMKALRGVFPKVDETFYLHTPVYQLWMFADYESKILEIAQKMNKFRVFPWHQGGADFTYPHINKAFGIKKALMDEHYDRLICIGDGYNDIEMLDYADIAIAMENTRFNELKEKATYIAPAIEKDELYDFFKSIDII